MVMCMPLICISKPRELVQTLSAGKRATDDSYNFLQVINRDFILGESESVYNCVFQIPS